MRFFQVLLFAAPLAGCFNFDEPICAYACSTAMLCPEDYQCRPDGYCHKQGSTESCAFSDAAMIPDQSANLDMSLAADLRNSDAGD